MATATMRRRSLLLGLLLCAFLVQSPHAAANVYWTDFAAETIGRANEDGTGVQRGFIKLLHDPQNVAVGSGGVFWTHTTRCWPDSGDSIGGAGLGGTAVNESLITGIALDCGGAVAVTESNIYWASYSFGDDEAAGIGKANLDGSEVNPAYIHPINLSTLEDPCFGEIQSLAVSDPYAYWIQRCASSTAIVRAALLGAGEPELVLPVNPGATIAVDAGHLYWTAGKKIGRANLDGTGVEPDFIDIGTGGKAVAVAVNSEHVYWAWNPHSYRPGAIGRANIDGSQLQPEFVENADSGGVAADDLSYPAGGGLGSASARATQKQHGSTIRVKVTVRADQNLTAKVTGRLKADSSYKLKPTSEQVAAGKTEKLPLHPQGNGAQKKVAQALQNGEKVTAKLTVNLTDEASNKETEKLSVKLEH